MSWKIEHVVVGPIQCNCYILSEPVSKKAYIIDPGAESADLLKFLQNRNFDLQAILITHAHIDHVGGIQMLYDEFSVPVYYHNADEMLYTNLKMQAAAFGFSPVDLQARQPVAGDGTLHDNAVFGTEDFRIAVLHTPGHTPGSVCFHAGGPKGETVFTGDTLFQGSIGRTDLWGGSFELIIQSIRSRLMVLDDHAHVFPGHGPATTIGEERKTNPFLLQYS
jgi:hydroxyacylglutathione hydrolase